MNRPFRVPAFPRLGDERGFSIVELMAAIGIFAIVMTAVASTLSSSLRVTRLNRQRSTAANLAAQEMDAVRATKFADLPLGQVVSTQTVDSIPYTVTRESEWISQSATSNACEGVSGQALAYLRVNVSVTWQQMSGTLPVRSHTLITPPTGAYDPTEGHVAVTVHDRDAGGQGGVKVLVDGPGGPEPPQFTSSEGCAFFAYLAAGAYTVTLDSPGFVDGQGLTQPSQPVSVNAGTTTAVGFDYDEAATLSLTLQGSAGGPVPNTVPVTVGNTKLLPLGTKTVAGSGAMRTVGNLFPYADGYHVWAGGCADADPEGLQTDGNPFYPGATRDPALSVAPAQTTSGVVTMPSVDVTVYEADGITPAAGETVVAEHDPDNGCAAGEQYTLGVTDAVGRLPAALPFGNWRFTVTGENPLTSWPTKVLAPPAQPTPEIVVVTLQ